MVESDWSAEFSAVVVGTGTMAPGIAAALAQVPGATVTICGRSPEAAEAAAIRATRLAGSAVRAVPFEPPTFAGVALVIETVLEDRAVKHDVLARASEHCLPTAIIATNTSSLSISELAASVRHPNRFVGLHFLNPAADTGVLEIAPGGATDASTMDAAVALAECMRKRPLTVRREIPGHIWNRLQFAVLRECLHLLDEGVADANDIDTAISAGLAPRWLAAGPLATVDLGGLRTFVLASQQLFGRLANGAEVSPRLVDHASDGTTFYEWTPQMRKQIVALRTETIATGREFAERRTAAMEPGVD